MIPLRFDIKKEADIEFETVDANRILAHLQEANGNGVNILILDACRDNPFKGFMKSARTGLAQMDAPTGSLIVYATAPNTAALDDPNGSNSVFTRRLLDVLRQTPTLNVSDILMRVRSDRNSRISGDSTTCTATCGNGWRIRGMTITTERQRTGVFGVI